MRIPLAENIEISLIKLCGGGKQASAACAGLLGAFEQHMAGGYGTRTTVSALVGAAEATRAATLAQSEETERIRNGLKTVLRKYADANVQVQRLEDDNKRLQKQANGLKADNDMLKARPPEVVERIVEVPGPEVEKLVPGPIQYRDKRVEVPGSIRYRDKIVEKLVEVPGPERIVPGPERLVHVPPTEEQIYAAAEEMMLDVANSAVSHLHNTNLGRVREGVAMLADEVRRNKR